MNALNVSANKIIGDATRALLNAINSADSETRDYALFLADEISTHATRVRRMTSDANDKS